MANKRTFQSDIWNKGVRLKHGQTFFDLKNGSAGVYLRIKQSKLQKDGSYKDECITIMQPELGAFKNLVDKAMALSGQQPTQAQAQIPVKPAGLTISQLKAQQGKNAYEKWTPDEEQRVIDMHKQGMSFSEIAALINRGEGAVKSRLKKKGVI
jgi:hypothetical protein